jgi:hypothetical protein
MSKSDVEVDAWVPSWFNELFEYAENHGWTYCYGTDVRSLNTKSWDFRRAAQTVLFSLYDNGIAQLVAIRCHPRGKESLSRMYDHTRNEFYLSRELLTDKETFINVVHAYLD